MSLLSSALLLINLLTVPPQGSIVPITIGRSVVPLNGPWRFRTGDDVRWADPDFDDAAWEAVDLTPAPGAHDPDVGLEGYVAGWGARGHTAYAGYAWYRMRVAVAASPGDTLAIVAPLEVDDAYELFVDGRKIGGSGDFSGRPPVAYNTRPLMVVLPYAPTVIAVRVWVAPSTMRDDPSAGGMRIAPAIGQMSGVSARYQLEWLEKFTGYVVDAVEPVAFVLLAVTAVVLAAFDPADAAYRWLAAALILLALRRVNQVVFYWTPYESAPTSILVTNILLTPLTLGAWTIAWRRWFALRVPAWAPAAAAALTLIYIIAQAAGSEPFAQAARWVFLLLYVLTIYQGVRQRRPDRWSSAIAILLMGVALFASELSLAHIPSIWFPFGTGVSRTQYALAAFVIVMFVVLLRRMLAVAARVPRGTPDPLVAHS